MGLKKNIKKKLKPKFQKLSYKYFFNEFRNMIIHDNIDSVKIKATYDTLNEIQKCINLNQRGAYMRFGDGDVYLLNNKQDSYQKADKLLAKEMLEAFQINEKNVFKSLAIHSEKFGFEDGMFDGNHKNTDALSISLLESTYMFFIGQKIYSPVALHFTATNDPVRANFFLKLLKLKAEVFIGSENISNETINKLFGDVKRVNSPSENAYSQIDRVYNESAEQIRSLKSFCVVIVAMGCSGRPLMKRLLNNINTQFFLFDFGSLLDGIDNVNSRTWLKVNNLNKKVLLEGL